MGLFRKIHGKLDENGAIAELENAGIADEQIKLYHKMENKERKLSDLRADVIAKSKRDLSNILAWENKMNKMTKEHPILSRIKYSRIFFWSREGRQYRQIKKQWKRAKEDLSISNKYIKIMDKRIKKHEKQLKVASKYLRNIWVNKKDEIKLINYYEINKLDMKNYYNSESCKLVEKYIKCIQQNDAIKMSEMEYTTKGLYSEIKKGIDKVNAGSKLKEKLELSIITVKKQQGKDNNESDVKSNAQNSQNNFKNNIAYKYKTKADYISKTIASLGELSQDAAKQPNRIQLAYIGHVIQAMEAGASFTHDDLLKNTIEYEKNDQGLNDVASKRADEELGKSLKDIRDEIDTYTQKIEEAKNNNQEYAEMEHSKEALECIFTIAKKYKDIEKMDKVKKQQQKQQQQNKSQGQQQAI